MLSPRCSPAIKNARSFFKNMEHLCQPRKPVVSKDDGTGACSGSRRKRLAAGRCRSPKGSVPVILPHLMDDPSQEFVKLSVRELKENLRQVEVCLTRSRSRGIGLQGDEEREDQTLNEIAALRAEIKSAVAEGIGQRVNPTPQIFWTAPQPPHFPAHQVARGIVAFLFQFAIFVKSRHFPSRRLSRWCLQASVAV